MTLGEELEMLYGRIATLEAELATERARLDKLVAITHWTHEPMHKGPRVVLDDLILKGVKR